MHTTTEKQQIAKQLQAKINAMQGLGKLSCAPVSSAFSPFSDAFPGKVFPKSAVHEFVSYEPAESASTNAFISALAGKLMPESGLCLWIATEKKIYPAGLSFFGLDPDRIVFIHAPKPKDALWIIEEALKCDAIATVIGEVRELSFTESRRLQLAVERSGVSGFIHRFRPYGQNSVACTTRWKITPIPSLAPDGLPGIGHSRWDVQLIKVKNGRPVSWQVTWSGGQFVPIQEEEQTISIFERHAG